MKPLFCLLPALAALSGLSACRSWHGMTGAVPGTSVKDVREMLAKREPAAKKYAVTVELVKEGQAVDVSTIELRPGQKGRAGQLRDFSWPTGYISPAVGRTPAGEDRVTTPMTPAAFANKQLGWACEATVTPKGGWIEVKGSFTETTFDGFARAPGELARPIKAADGTVLTDNKVVQPRFTHRESPLIVFAMPGQTYRMDVNSSAKRAWLNISCAPVAPDLDTADYKIIPSAQPGTKVHRGLQFGSAAPAKPLLTSLP